MEGEKYFMYMQEFLLTQASNGMGVIKTNGLLRVLGISAFLQNKQQGNIKGGFFPELVFLVWGTILEDDGWKFSPAKVQNNNFKFMQG
jgi:hypothetical protein